MDENIDISKLDIATIMNYAKKYLKLKKENNQRQKKYYTQDSKKDIIREKSKIRYYIKKDLYHPEINPNGANEGRKFKRESTSAN